ncbi:hypothetical protein [Paraliomyxa miuraensis]|uniref:hypothetical protein n=1 Tax=Paraliomyxa miuraensis TaxID=376150 RepID=UPI00224D86CA|nr:hypothetical protein [Paraliomyxa miuraensis]MCX4245037.1 hypothetical protein [Paraliomyxa miuraensis]
MSTQPRLAPGELQSRLPPGWPRFLAAVVEHSLRIGLRRPRDFLRSFPPRSIMRALANDPERRGRLLEATTGVRQRIAIRKSLDSAAEDLQIALDERITDAAAVVSLLTPDDRVRLFDRKQLWGFVVEPGYGSGAAEHGERIPAIREHTSFVIEQALFEGLISPRDIISAISVPTLVERLPRAELATLLERMLEDGRAGVAFTDDLLFQMVPMSTIVTHVPMATLWDWVITAKIAAPLGLVPDPMDFSSKDDALFDELAAAPSEADDEARDVTVIIDGDEVQEPTRAAVPLRSFGGGRSA